MGLVLGQPKYGFGGQWWWYEPEYWLANGYRLLCVSLEFVLLGLGAVHLSSTGLLATGGAVSNGFASFKLDAFINPVSRPSSPVCMLGMEYNPSPMDWLHNPFVQGMATQEGEKQGSSHRQRILFLDRALWSVPLGISTGSGGRDDPSRFPNPGWADGPRLGRPPKSHSPPGPLGQVEQCPWVPGRIIQRWPFRFPYNL